LRISGRLGGANAPADAGLWPQATEGEGEGEGGRVEMLQVSAGNGGRGGGRRAWVTGGAVVQMGSLAGLGVAAVVVVLEWRRRRRVATGLDYTSV
jgi:hypothetical protein